MIGGIGNILFLTHSQTCKWVRSMGFFVGSLTHVRTLCGQILVSRRTDDDPRPLPSLPLPLPPCVRPNRPRVYVQNVPVFAGTTRTCSNTCARGAGTHGDVLNVHTGTFLSGHTGGFQRATQHNTTTTTTTTTTPHRDRDRQRKKTETERDREDGRGETRQEKREERR